MTELRRAAVVVELEDGTRMLYEFDPSSVITTTLEYPDAELDWTLTRVVHQGAPRLIVKGTLLRGTIWKGDVPTGGEEPEALAPAVRVLEAGS